MRETTVCKHQIRQLDTTSHILPTGCLAERLSWQYPQQLCHCCQLPGPLVALPPQVSVHPAQKHHFAVRFAVLNALGNRSAHR